MKINLHTLAWDTDMGTGSSVHMTEEDMIEELISSIEPDEEDLEKYLNDEMDLHDLVQASKDYLDTWTWDQITIQVPLWKILRDTLTQTWRAFKWRRNFRKMKRRNP